MEDYVEAFKSVAEGIEQKTFVDALRQIFYQEERNFYILELQESINGQNWKKVIQCIRKIDKKGEIFQQNIKCEKIESLMERSETWQESIRICLELLSLNFSKEHLGMLKKLIREKSQ